LRCITAEEVVKKIESVEGKNQLSKQLQGIISANKGDYDKSIVSLRQAFEDSGGAYSSMVLLIKSYIKAGKINDAHAFIEDILRANPDNIDPLFIKAELFLIQGEITKAEEVYNNIIQLKPEVINTYQQLAKLYLARNDKSLALSALNNGLNAIPNAVSLLLAKASIYESQNKMDDAIAVYDSILGISPNAEVAINNLASLLTDFRDDGESLKRAYQLALRLNVEKLPQFKDTLGWAYYKIGNIQKANQLFMQAVEDLPDDPDLRYHLGVTYEELDQKDLALTHYTKAKELSGSKYTRYHEEINDAISRF